MIDCMVIDNELIDILVKEARMSPRLRMNYDLRNSNEDRSQRMLNAIEPGTELPIHRHRNSSESCMILRGKAEEILYDNQGNITDRILMQPGFGCVGIDIEKGRWHKIISLETGTVIFEAKDGPYEPLSQDDILRI